MIIYNIDKKFIEIFILLGMLCILYFPVLSDLKIAWDNKPQSSHGYLVFPLCIYLIYTMRHQILHIKLEKTIMGIPIIVIGIVLYLTGLVGKISTISNISLLLNIFGVLLSIGGLKFVQRLTFPILFLAFMFPIPDSIYISLTSPLKLFTSSVSVDILQIFGLPVFRDGNIIQLPNMSLEVVEACSGLRSLTSYIFLGVILANLLPGQGKFIIIIMVFSSLPISISVNVLRLVLTGVFAMYLGPKTAEGFFHEFSGIIVFLVGLILYFGLYQMLMKHSLRNNVN
jgi:exosortase